MAGEREAAAGCRSRLQRCDSVGAARRGFSVEGKIAELPAVVLFFSLSLFFFLFHTSVRRRSSFCQKILFIIIIILAFSGFKKGREKALEVCFYFYFFLLYINFVVFSFKFILLLWQIKRLIHKKWFYESIRLFIYLCGVK